MLEALFGTENYNVAKHMLDATEVRHRALATNLAHAQTPGYQRIDVSEDFAERLRLQVERGHFDPARAPQAVAERDLNATTQRADGNTVDLEHELVELNRNALQYQYLSQYVSGSLKHLQVAITGKLS